VVEIPEVQDVEFGCTLRSMLLSLLLPRYERRENRR
jgi:hypothetical protein